MRENGEGVKWKQENTKKDFRHERDKTEFAFFCLERLLKLKYLYDRILWDMQCGDCCGEFKAFDKLERSSWQTTWPKQGI
jgi:hypothetical protein